ncbi:MAG: hypothetical protein HOZ81_50345 [Streptomyces sp.]|nr:hypothetical protein [Streptomyces sp.]NUS24375.1 hypothetical protein [Streptomyces sp.]
MNLNDFYIADSGDNDDRVNLVCSRCPADKAVVTTWDSLDCYPLGDINTIANTHIDVAH